MRLALLSDLHANHLALEACLAHACRESATDLAILGDLVGYGPHPREVVRRCIDLQRAGAVVLRGNHDEPPSVGKAEAGSWQALSARWTHEQLDAADRQWLASLATTHVIGRAFLVHATADDPTHWRYLTDARIAARSLEAAARDDAVRYVFGGHVHHQQLFFEGRGGRLMLFNPRPGVAIPVGVHRHWLATVGSVGQPRDGDRRAGYALLDTEAQTLQFHRVGYDVAATCEALRSQGLPRLLAERLEMGR